MLKNKLIVVTGGAGFVGSRLVARLAPHNRVIVVDNFVTTAPLRAVQGVEYRTGHTKDIGTLVPETPDIVFHLGEYARVEKSFDDVALVLELNMLGTLGVLEFWRARKCKLVYAGSSTKFSDGGLGRNLSPYTWTKAANTELVSNYGAWFHLTYAIAYFYNVYGPGERAGAFGTLIEIFRQKHLSGEPLTVNSPGTQRRNFTHVDDIVDGLVIVGERGEGDNFGLGNTSDYSVLEVARMFGGPIEMRPEAPGNRMNSDVDTSKTELLGWKATRHLKDYVDAITRAA